MAFPAYAKILFEGYEKDRASAVERTTFDDGMVKQLKTKSRVLVSRAITIRLYSHADYVAFIAWFQNDINGGADWFDLVDPEDGVTRLVRFVNKLDKERALLGNSLWDIRATIEHWSNA